MSSHQARLIEMVNAALTEEQIEKLPMFFNEHGLEITKTDVINSDEGIIGYQIFASQSDS
jgi:hypothetical protein